MAARSHADIVHALQGIYGATSATMLAHARATHSNGAPSIRVESADGITVFPGIKGDDSEAHAARLFATVRLSEIAGVRA